MEMSHILITLCFGSISTEIENIDTERAIRNEISNILGKYYKAGNICNFVIADDEVISEKLKASQPTKACPNCGAEMIRRNK